MLRGFYECIKTGNKEVFEYLYSQGMDIRINEIQNKEKKHPLIFALEHGQYDIAKFLLDKFQANINCRSHFKTPLHIAVERKDYELAKYLLEKGSDQNRYLPMMTTPIHIACQQRPQIDEEMVKLLLKYNADPTLWDSKKKTAIDYAHENSENGQDILEILPKEEELGEHDRIQN